MVAPDDPRRQLRAYYEANPLMVSSPFGGVDSLNAPLLESVWDALGIDPRDAAVLDVGCGRGMARALVDQAGGMYTGLDFVVSGQGFRLVQGDALRLPFRDAAFDLVCCMDAFEHFPDPDAGAREFYRVLKPGGRMFLSVPNYANVAGAIKWLYETLGWYDVRTWAPFRRWQPQELELPMTGPWVRRIFRTAGFVRPRRIAHAGETGLGLCPWIDHPKMPDAIRFRVQRLFTRLGPGIVRVAPTASLHGFWKFEKE